MIWLLTYMPATDRQRMWNEKAPPQPVTDRWISESSWTKEAVVADFERRFPGAKVISLKPAWGETK